MSTKYIMLFEYIITKTDSIFNRYFVFIGIYDISIINDSYIEYSNNIYKNISTKKMLITLIKIHDIFNPLPFIFSKDKNYFNNLIEMIKTNYPEIYLTISLNNI